MKNLLIILLLVAGGIFFSGYTMFSQSRVFAYLDRLEDEINKGHTVAACNRLADSMVFSIRGTSTNPTFALSGGKAELCEHFAQTAHMYETALIADRHYMADLSVRRNLLNWNSATVSYAIYHEVEYFPSREKVRSKSKERLVIDRADDAFIIKKWDTEVLFE
ncbi:MAG: hypothetical protein LBE33_00645 [Zoogloeaceae bacterium]|jgi:hypothetical protein|nr:hypothetical protein [Zoogloeaceae bacterium]